MPDMSRYYITELTAEQYEETSYALSGWRKILSPHISDLCKPVPMETAHDRYLKKYDFWAESWADAKEAHDGNL
tara:strand:+ start:256 stop:477 length:222 start_codon:yes stop_codon:yes gene_type:complete